MSESRVRKICIATSTRADWGLLSPLAGALAHRPDVDLKILATNMHLLPRYGHTIDEIRQQGYHVAAEVAMPDTDDSPASKVRAMAQCMAGTADALADIKPDLLVILGDRYEMLAVASAAAVMTIPIVHIAGGEISEGAIDDSIRHAISKLSALHLTATEPYRQRVIQMGEDPGRVINTGAIGVWNITHQSLMSVDELSRSLDFEIIPQRTLLVTYHPATLDETSYVALHSPIPDSPGQRCRAMLDALDRFPDYRTVITYPNNDAGSEEIIAEILAYQRANPERVLVIKSLGMLRYLSMLRYVAAVVGNSSSGIVEVPSMGIPTVDIGIRQRGRIAADSVIHCSDSTDEIASAIDRALSPQMQALAARCENPYGRADTLDTMVEAILSADPEALRHKRFYDINTTCK